MTWWMLLLAGLVGGGVGALALAIWAMCNFPPVQLWR